jgi:hypothetical protein
LTNAEKRRDLEEGTKIRSLGIKRNQDEIFGGDRKRC